ncbi:MAG: PKD domain-containing protein, partial [Bacteroidota bacterium]
LGPLTYLFQSASQNATTYLWDFGTGVPVDSSQNPSYTYAFDGTYTATHIAINECGSDTATIVLFTNLDDDFIRSVQVLPNPFSDYAEIRFDNPGGEIYGLRLFDQRGRLIREYAEGRTDHFRIERGELAPGLYLFQITHEGRQFTGKIMAQ